MRPGLLIVSLIPALLLVYASGSALNPTGPHPQANLALFPSLLVCAVHIIVLIVYATRPSSLWASLTMVMAVISLLCVFLLACAAQPNFEVHGIAPTSQLHLQK
jgi:peptidoglycan biosynthesis protein MviN/MurJ (putative lipid II flippase)